MSLLKTNRLAPACDRPWKNRRPTHASQAKANLLTAPKAGIQATRRKCRDYHWVQPNRNHASESIE